MKLKKSTSTFDSINDHLTDHFITIKSERDDQAVYLIEHDLAPNDFPELFGVVGALLALRPLDLGSSWRQLYLPLLVAATEVAYYYEGNGTDYWPIFEEKLSYSFSMQERGVLRDLFELFHQQFNGPTPSETEWSRNFSIICWPIANAMLPRDMRLPFSVALANARFDISGMSNEQIKQRLIGVRVPFSSTRYRSWLSTESIAADFARYFLLTIKPATVFPATLNRIEKDMIADRQVRLALRNARIRHSSTNLRNAKLQRKTDKHHFGDLQLRKRDDRLVLEGVVPTLSKLSKGREWLERNTRNGRWQPKPWGLTDVQPLSPSEILFGTPFTIPVRQLFSQHSVPDFFSEGDTRNLPDPLKKWCNSVGFDLRLPFVFDSSGENPSKRSFQKVIDPTREQLVVLNAELCEELPSGLAVIDRVSSLSVIKVVAENSAVESWLKKHGLRLGTTLETNRIAPSSFGDSTTGSEVYFQDDVIGFSIGELGNQALSLEVSCNSKPFGEENIKSEGIYLIGTRETGHYEARLVGKVGLGDIDSWHFQIRDADEELYDNDVCQIEILGIANTTVDLTLELLSIEINSIRELSGVEVEIGLSTEDETHVLTLQELPMRISAKHPIWKKLIGEKTRRAISRGSDLTVSVVVRDISEGEWLLENDSISLWWEFEDEGIPRPRTDNTTYECHRISLSSAALNYSQADESDVQLLVPSDFEGPKFELPCLVICPKETTFPAAPHHPDRLPRRLDNVDGYFGLREWVQKYIALACANSPHTIAALHCSKYKQSYLRCIREVLCGRRWVERQDHQEELLHKKSPLEVFLDTAEVLKAGFDQGGTEFPIPGVLRSELMGHVVNVLPRLWWRFPLFHFTDTLGEQLDKSFKDAFSAAADSLTPDQSDLAQSWMGISPFTDRAVWENTLLLACETLNGAHLADLVLPLEGGDSLLCSPTDGLSLKELTQIVLDWRSEFVPNHRSSVKWTSDRVHIALCLYIFPSALRTCDWETVLEALMTDRVTARVIAFLAWKKGHLEGLADK